MQEACRFVCIAQRHLPKKSLATFYEPVSDWLISGKCSQFTSLMSTPEVLYCPQRDLTGTTTQKMKFSTKDFFSKCDQIRRKLWIFSNLLKKSLMENFIFCAVSDWLKQKIYCALIYFPILQRKIISCHNSISVNFKKLKHEKHFQKQPPRDVLKKRCPENIQQIYRRTPMPKCDFNKVAK